MEHALTPEYRVELDVYNGPLDLLLYLIKRDELDIYDIPIARITQTYIDYVHMLRGMKDAEGLDINVAGDFLVMAATLMEIKSAMLLPRAPVSEKGDSGAAAELADPRLELVQQLLEYKRLKDSATALDRQHRLHESRFPRYPGLREGDADEMPPIDLEEVQMWDLLAAFDRLMKEVGVRKPRYHEVTYDDTPIDLHAADIEDRLKREGKVTLKQLIVGRKSRSEMVGVFLALLELIREKKILVDQDLVSDDIQIVSAPAEHRKTYEHASLGLAKIEAVKQETVAAQSPESDEAAAEVVPG
ncbi:MAG TPA: segregation/condensation protein A [Tepidisphaeraceae bacterium]|nr:segregation/condensation protein A [Tepidisphaeraceae bacterium]